VETGGVTPVAVELRPDAESLVTFEHPEEALYVFGPEDGGTRPYLLFSEVLDRELVAGAGAFDPDRPPSPRSWIN
jgi:hypothetical protein